LKHLTVWKRESCYWKPGEYNRFHNTRTTHMLDSEEEEGTRRRENGKEQSNICCQREVYHN
jgi:hypothetical protein